jgi:hypothetical protein
MATCFYHPTHDAGATCIGCKMPVGQVCKDEGKNGFCAACFKKVAALSGQVTDMKKTGMVGASQKATMVKTSGRPTGSMNITYCFHHFDAVASGSCSTCHRPFCGSCLEASGICTHCAKLGDTPAERKPAAPRPRPAAAPAKPASVGLAPKSNNMLYIGLGILAVVAVLVFIATRH